MVRDAGTFLQTETCLPAGRESLKLITESWSTLYTEVDTFDSVYYVYVLRSLKDGRLYKGMTKDIKARLRTHNAGKVFATKGFRPWILIYSEGYSHLAEALSREKQLKSGAGREFLASLNLKE